MSERVLHITVAWITRHVQDVVPVQVEEGTTVAQAIEASGLAHVHGLNLGALSVGVAGKRRRMEAPVHDGERIELLRPLVADPKDARRRRAARQDPGTHTKRRAADR